jgi:hypothetical protein
MLGGLLKMALILNIAKKRSKSGQSLSLISTGK